MSVVNINKKIPLFRANSTNGEMKNRNYAYFVFGNDAINLITEQYAKFEGNKIHKYKLSKPLTLLDMGDVETIEFLKSKGNASVNRSIDTVFKIKNGKVIRKSVLKYDLAVSRLICELGYDGYYAPPLTQKNNSKMFHQEIMLCNPMDKVNYESSMVPLKPLKPISRKTFNNSNYKFTNMNSNSNSISNSNNFESPRKKPRFI